jgi:hypothetical protein
LAYHNNSFHLKAVLIVPLFPSLNVDVNNHHFSLSSNSPKHLTTPSSLLAETEKLCLWLAGDGVVPIIFPNAKRRFTGVESEKWRRG